MDSTFLQLKVTAISSPHVNSFFLLNRFLPFLQCILTMHVLPFACPGIQFSKCELPLSVNGTPPFRHVYSPMHALAISSLHVDSLWIVIDIPSPLPPIPLPPQTPPTLYPSPRYPSWCAGQLEYYAYTISHYNDRISFLEGGRGERGG